MPTMRTMSREIGTALAVLAIYLLTVLAPIHEARASQRAFEELGYTALETGWALCTSVGVTDGDQDAEVSKCPATGVAKTEFVLPTAAVLPAALDLASLATPLLLNLPAFTPVPVTSPSGPRAPPVTV
ncbi:hypothetical protein [Devosia sp.]|uniref:hypothetical protein n=1 Tax=Devosia sp. TaxID=1871048 RepID=UPI002FCC1958